MTPAKSKKPTWPYPHITKLTADVARNQWVKRIRGRLYSFGVLSDPEAALRRYQNEGPNLHAGLGRTARPSGEGVTVAEVCAYWLQAKTVAAEVGDLSPKTLRGYEDIAGRVDAKLGHRQVASLRPLDFEKLRNSFPFGPARRGMAVTVVKMIFNWAHDAEIVDAPPRFGKAFKGATAKEKREIKHRAGANLFTADQIHALLEAAGNPQLKAMILLGINAGFGNTDCATLLRSAVDLDPRKSTPRLPGVIDFPRPKTGVERVVPLWPETVTALKEAFESRPKATRRADDRLCFITRFGHPWVHGKTDAIALEFRKLMETCRLVKPWAIADPKKAGRPAKRGRRPTKKRRSRASGSVVSPLGFYTLRRTFRTVADEAGDQHAVHRIMGHVVPGMSGIYVQKIGVDRLRAVTDHVRAWLFAADTATGS